MCLALRSDAVKTKKGSGSPIAKEALEKIGALFDIEGAPPEQRRNIRQRLRSTAWCPRPNCPYARE
jgi:hypothetical protein